jgi:hypothetical protein
MPSRSSSATIGALVTALGLAIALIGLVQSSKADSATGLALTVIGVVPLLLLAYRVHQASAGLQDVEEHRAEIQGEAFGLALELIRTGQLTALTTNKTD